MKTKLLFKIMLLTMVALNYTTLLAQNVEIVPIEQLDQWAKDPNNKNKGVYAKDVNGTMTPVIGYWRGVKDGRDYHLWVDKKEKDSIEWLNEPYYMDNLSLIYEVSISRDLWYRELGSNIRCSFLNSTYPQAFDNFIPKS